MRGVVHQILLWLPGIGAAVGAMALAAAAVWPSVKIALDPVEAIVMDYPLLSAAVAIVAVLLWYWAWTITKPKPDSRAELAMPGDDYSIKTGDIFGHGNRVGHDIYAPVQRTMDDGIKAKILRELPRDKPITVMGVLGDGESCQLALEIHGFLKEHGFPLAEPDGISQGVFNPPARGLSVSETQNGRRFTVGPR